MLHVSFVEWSNTFDCIVLFTLRMRLLDFDSGWLVFEEVLFLWLSSLKTPRCIELQIDIVGICARKWYCEYTFRIEMEKLLGAWLEKQCGKSHPSFFDNKIECSTAVALRLSFQVVRIWIWFVNLCKTTGIILHIFCLRSSDKYSSVFIAIFLHFKIQSPELLTLSSSPSLSHCNRENGKLLVRDSLWLA